MGETRSGTARISGATRSAARDCQNLEDHLLFNGDQNAGPGPEVVLGITLPRASDSPGRETARTSQTTCSSTGTMCSTGTGT